MVNSEQFSCVFGVWEEYLQIKKTPTHANYIQKDHLIPLRIELELYARRHEQYPPAEIKLLNSTDGSLSHCFMIHLFSY